MVLLSWIFREPMMKNSLIRLGLVYGAILFAVCLLNNSSVQAQPERCDPTKTMTAEACAKCHGNEVQVWKNTPHFRTFEELGRRPRAKEICKNLKLRSVKRSDVCLDCHFTVQDTGSRLKPIAGVSCESCHGASKNWISIHNDYGGPTATKESESPQHRLERLETASSLGMRNTQNLYLIASSCLRCHTIPNEKLVNVGGHLAATDDFELVAYSQGSVRHNFLRTNNTQNARSTPERLRVMYIVGLIADLEYSTRATAEATSKSTYGLKVANRAAKKAVQLYQLQQKVNNPRVQAVLEAFASASLRINNRDQLTTIADQIKLFGQQFAQEYDGSNLAAVDPFLPDPSTYK